MPAPDAGAVAANHSATRISHLWTVDWNRCARDLGARVRGQMYQQGGNLRRLHPLRPIGFGIAGAIRRSVHGAR